jgi:hypothetical protein
MSSEAGRCHTIREAYRDRVSDKIVMNYSTLINATFLPEGYICSNETALCVGTELEVGDRAPFRGTTQSSEQNYEDPQCEETTDIPGMRVGCVARLPQLHQSAG